jgi:lambda family phage portal protein
MGVRQAIVALFSDPAIMAPPPVAALPAPEPPPAPAPEPRAKVKLKVNPNSRARLAYDGAARNRLNADWLTNSSGANDEVIRSLSTLRDRCSDLARNNAWALKALESLTSNVVSTGIRAKWANPQTQARWDEWVLQASSDSDLDLYGLQSLAVRSWLERGDCFVRRRWRRPEDGLAAPMQIELLEGDFCDHIQTRTPQAGGVVTQGVEFDAIGRRAAYWLYRQHPGEVSTVYPGAGFGEVVRVPAADIAHLYRPTRAGQVRGVPWLAAVIGALRDLGAYQTAERVRKRAQAGQIGVLIPADDATYDEETTDAVGPTVTDADGATVDTMTPGSVLVARNGKDFRFSTPSSDAGYVDFVNAQLRQIAAGVLSAYEIISGDLSQVNYSSIRLGLVEYQRVIKVLQTQVLIPLVMRKIAQWFKEACLADGTMQADEPLPQWVLPEREEIDRLTAVQAAIAAIRAGLQSRIDAVTAGGGDAAEVLAEIAADLDALDALGITLDTDPRHPVSGPLQQPAAPAEATP